MRVTIIHQHDPGDSHVGGIGTFLNTFLKYAPPDLEVRLVGVTADPSARPVGQWRKMSAGGREYEFLPLIAARPNHRGLLPVTFRLAAAVARSRKKIPFKDSILEMHRIEPAPAVASLPNPKVLFLHAHSRDIRNPKSDNVWKHFPPAYFWLERRHIGGMGRVFIVREDAAADYRRDYPSVAERISFLPTWVDDEVFVSFPEDERARHKGEIARANGLDPGRKWLLFVGRFDGQKDPFRLLESFRGIAARQRGLDLMMVGEGLLEGRIREFIASHGLGSRVRLVGPQPQRGLARWMNSAECLCLSSAYEGMPRVVVEALQCGLPVVTTAVGETPRLIGDSAGGRLVRDPSPEAFGEAVLDLLQSPPSREQCRRQAAPYAAARILETVYAEYRRLWAQR